MVHHVRALDVVGLALRRFAVHFNRETTGVYTISIIYFIVDDKISLDLLNLFKSVGS